MRQVVATIDRYTKRNIGKDYYSHAGRPLELTQDIFDNRMHSQQQKKLIN